MSLHKELHDIASKWKLETNKLNGEKLHDQHIASLIVTAFGTMSEELSNVIQEAEKYSTANEILDLAADLEWQDYTPEERKEKWGRLLELLDSLSPTEQ